MKQLLNYFLATAIACLFFNVSNGQLRGGNYAGSDGVPRDIQFRDNNNDNTGYIVTNSTGNGFLFKSPENANIIDLRLDSFSNGILKSNSVNCEFTIATINNNPSFIKIVKKNIDSDLILYDIITGIIFNKINREFNQRTSKSLFDTCLVQYKQSLLSYYKVHHTNNYWNYNDLISYQN